MAHHKSGREVVYVERGGDTSVKWLLWGALLGGGLALLYAPRSGEETRRSLQRTLWKLRAMTEEKLDELTQQFGSGAGRLGDDEEFDDEDEVAGDYDAPEAEAAASPRQELERRLAEARARRRAEPDVEEPLA